MKNFTLSMIAVMAMSTSVMAEWYPANGPDSYSAIYGNDSHSAQKNSGLYGGVGYSYINLNAQINEAGNTYEADVDGNALTLIGGYNLSKYFAIEGRYSYTLGNLNYDDTDGDSGDIHGDISNLAVYCKPMYSIDNASFYGLLGLGQVKLSDDNFSSNDSETNFQWGIGASFAVNNSINVFADYIRFHDSTDGFGNAGANIDFLIDALSFGVTFKF